MKRQHIKNYRGISLQDPGYLISECLKPHVIRIFFVDICLQDLGFFISERLKPHVIRIVDPYQCGFRPENSTTD